MKKLIIALLFCAVAQSFATQIYLHPVTLGLSGGIPGFTWITVTGEVEKDEDDTFILQGSFISLGSDDLNVNSFSVRGGINNYLNGEQEGVFLSPRGFVEFATFNDDFLDQSATAFGGGILGHVGYAGKWESAAMFIDAGLGYQFFSVSGDDIEGATGAGLSFDLNFGVGFNL